MTCLDENDLGGYVEGTLDQGSMARIEAHLAACEACRMLVSDVQAIRLAARTLEAHVPPAHVWRRIEAALADEPRRWPLMSLWAWQPLAASAVALLLVTSLSWVGGRLAVIDSRPVPAAASLSNLGDTVASDLDGAEKHFNEAIAGLERITRAEREGLDPEMAGVLRANMTVIDEAIGQSRVALATEPESDVAQESLFEALRDKVALLQDTLALINEMRKGNQEGAARIASELLQ